MSKDIQRWLYAPTAETITRVELCEGEFDLLSCINQVLEELGGKGACSVVVMATTVFQNFSCPLYWLNFGVGILSNILQIKVIFHKRIQHVHHSSKYLFRHAHEVCKAWEHGTEGSQHIKSSRGKGEFPFSTPSLCLWIFISSSPVRLRDYQLAQSCF